jgi:hypothetical protein
MRIENDYIHCEDTNKSTILQKIISEIKTILERLEHLLKHFIEIQEYERIYTREN